MLLSIIIPVYYNEKSLPILYERLNKVSGEIKDVDFEYVFVDDGSGDNSYNVLHGIAKNDTCVKVVKLSRNLAHLWLVWQDLHIVKEIVQLL